MNVETDSDVLWRFEARCLMEDCEEEEQQTSINTLVESLNT